MLQWLDVELWNHGLTEETKTPAAAGALLSRFNLFINLFLKN